jgi:hypothetical protein
MKMLRKTMIALLAVASISILMPDVALAGHGGGGGGGGHGGGGGFGGGHGGGFGGGRGFGGGGFGGAGFAARSGSFGSSFARSTAIGAAGVGAGVAGFHGARIATGNFNHGVWHGGFHHGFRHGRRFFVAGGFWGPGYYDDYYDYPYYTADDYYYNGGCYVVRERVHTRYGWRIRPVQVCG